MTLEQDVFVLTVRNTYAAFFGPVPFEKDFAAAMTRGDELEIARLTGLLIIAMDFGGIASQRAAGRWLELFEPTVPLAS